MKISILLADNTAVRSLLVNSSLQQHEHACMRLAAYVLTAQLLCLDLGISGIS